MPYVNVDDLKLMIPSTTLEALTDDKAAVINDTVVARHILDASTLVNMYLRTAGYAVPFADGSVPDEVRKITADIAIYFLYTRTLEEMTIDNIRRINYGNAVATLKAIANGEAQLSIEIDTPPESAAIIGSSSMRLYPKDFWKLLP